MERDLFLWLALVGRQVGIAQHTNIHTQRGTKIFTHIYYIDIYVYNENE